MARVGQEAGRWGRVGQPGWTVAGAARPGRPGSRSSGAAVIVAGSSGGGSSPSSCSGAVSITRGRLSECPTVSSDTLVSVLTFVSVRSWGAASQECGGVWLTGSAGAAAT